MRLKSGRRFDSGFACSKISHHLKALLSGVMLLCFAAKVYSAPQVFDNRSVPLCGSLSEDELARAKRLWIDVVGASHSQGFRVGCKLLQDQEPRYAVTITESGVMESYTTNHLRISRAYWNAQHSYWSYGTGEDAWYASESGVEETKEHILFCNTNGFRLSVLAFGWSWQPSWHNMSSSDIDPVHHVRWSGSSVGGPDGDRAWGLDSSSYAVTTNRISMESYIRATEEYRDFCRTNGFSTKVIFTTAPVDYTGDTAYQVYLKNNYIRNYVSNSTDAILFDFADILCWDDSGNRATNAWTDLAGNKTFYEWIAQDNYLNLDGSFGGSNPYHFGERGALRLAKALWYMLAVISAPEPIRVQSELVSGSIQLRFNAKAYTAYAVESSSDLSNWQVATNIPAASTDHEAIVEEKTGGNPALFYRVCKTSGP